MRQVARLSFNQKTFHLLTTPLNVLKAQAEEEVMLYLLVCVTLRSNFLMKKCINDKDFLSFNMVLSYNFGYVLCYC